MQWLRPFILPLSISISACATAPAPETGSLQANRKASPASLNCIQNRGYLEIVQTPAGEKGICVLPDGKRCDEWEMFRGNCPVRTVNVTMGLFGL